MFPNLKLFNIVTIPMYGTTFAIAFFAALLIARKISPKYGLSKEDMTFGAVYGAIGLLVGAKLLFFLTKLPKILMHFKEFLELCRVDPGWAFSYAFGGFVFYGGLIGTVLGIARYCYHFKVPYKGFLEVCAPLIPLVHGFGRIGCFLAGCCYGKEYHGFLCVQFPYNEMIPELSAVPRVPVQLMEAGLNFIMFGILFFLLMKKKTRPGQLMGIYLLYYTVARYLLELLRGDILRGKVGVFSTSQIISLLLLPVGIVLVSGKWLPKKLAEKEIKEAKEVKE